MDHSPASSFSTHATSITDPHGYMWTIATRKEDLTHEELEQRQAEWMKKFAAQPTR